jgi:ribosomal protein RSM22 (predicted rRNA methylase)
MRAKGGTVPYEDERYCWLAVSRARKSANAGAARILAPPQDSKPGIALKLCTPQGLETRFVARRDKLEFSAARKTQWSDIV